MTDMINPNHYRGDRKFEPIAVIEDWGLNYRLGNAVKYISRNGRKPGEDRVEGLKKAIWYLEREIAALEPSQYSVAYQDVLEDHVACAANGEDPLLEYGIGAAQEVPYEATNDDWLDFWDDDDEFSLDITAGSVFLKRNDGPVGGVGVDTLFWDADDDYMWDPTLGPTEPLSEHEISSIKSKKDLNQFEDDEIVSTVHRRGLIIGVKKDGSTCLLNPQGNCE